jgi:hypothetical protein
MSREIPWLSCRRLVAELVEKAVEDVGMHRKRREPAVQDWLCRTKRIPAMTQSTTQSSSASG